ncbi:hypothetical protein [Georgenia sp. SUBG003]|uniref:hypothetical protein n=1 Tax=Georgenia sp. SUBG003 TaxID=1497974 RepID=UPI003AB1166C
MSTPTAHPRPAAPASPARVAAARAGARTPGARPLRARTGFRLTFLVPGALALVLGLDAALGLLGLPQLLGPALGLARLPDVHGPLMVLGFVGTVISLERAVALGLPPGYTAPAVSGLAALAIVSPLPLPVGQGLLVLAQVTALLVYRQLLARQPAVAVTVQVLGATAALGASVLWLGGVPVPALTPWLVAFLVLTIFGERLELARTEVLSPAASRAALGIAVALLGSAVVSLLRPTRGSRSRGSACSPSPAGSPRRTSPAGPCVPPGCPGSSPPACSPGTPGSPSAGRSGRSAERSPRAVATTPCSTPSCSGSSSP